ncbi:4467_t:CDS:2, partial [Funneliformis geosporum]
SLEWKYNSTTRNMTVCKLRGNESVDYTIPLESEPFNQIRLIDMRLKFQNLDFLRNNLGEGLTICMEFTCELVPVEELIRRAYKDVDKLMANFDDKIIFPVEKNCSNSTRK